MNKFSLTAILLAVLLLVTYYLVYSGDNTTVLYSETGCCSISVTTDQHTPEFTKYIVVYTDNTNGETSTEVETTQVDCDYMVNIFQDYCYTHHN